MSSPCPCGSSKLFDACCERFLKGSLRAKTPEQLMRSRYCAYALGGYGDYLLQTWFPATARGLTATMLSRLERKWLSLEILAKQQSGDRGEVEFKALYLGDDGEQHEMHERSVFQRSGGHWLYVGGDVSTTPKSS